MTSSSETATDRTGSADDALFRPVRAGNAFEETVERLLQTVRLGVVAPGDRLPTERELAAKFNVSRVTLREAIRALQQAGYVESRRGRYGGTFVAESLPRPDRRSLKRLAQQMGSGLDDALTLRDVLETGAAEAAAKRDLSRHEREYLHRRLEATATSNLENYRRLDSRLHLAIAEATGSASLTSAVADVRMRMNELLDAIPLLSRNIEHSNQQHAAIITAILDGDAEAARQAMAEHVSGTASLLRGFLA
ncbi:FadR/GntR family transcriptional regulator [Phytoactinopolyspora mesophila]|uniref:GntR family transcriptional regulator n=1 Tax=Phytoactinopolyspora mesophila TaxID=2650750 RepID=A0A7K3M5A6_9ACTN|nr:GntR family transcriptional regulator [Phytoactinopolyspora mesophila]NDL58499.1 GntR family transcriptional regulator [Phytoactinopolyspora mesophila]